MFLNCLLEVCFTLSMEQLSSLTDINQFSGSVDVAVFRKPVVRW